MNESELRAACSAPRRHRSLADAVPERTPVRSNKLDSCSHTGNFHDKLSSRRIDPMSAAGSRSTTEETRGLRIHSMFTTNCTNQSPATFTHLARARVWRGSIPNDRKIVAIARGRRHSFGLGDQPTHAGSDSGWSARSVHTDMAADWELNYGLHLDGCPRRVPCLNRCSALISFALLSSWS
jgi:hypothetical protein